MRGDLPLTLAVAEEGEYLLAGVGETLVTFRKSRHASTLETVHVVETPFTPETPIKSRRALALAATF